MIFYISVPAVLPEVPHPVPHPGRRRLPRPLPSAKRPLFTLELLMQEDKLITVMKFKPDTSNIGFFVNDRKPKKILRSKNWRSGRTLLISAIIENNRACINFVEHSLYDELMTFCKLRAAKIM